MKENTDNPSAPDLNKNLFGSKFTKNLDELRESRERLHKSMQELSTEIKKTISFCKKTIVLSTIFTLWCYAFGHTWVSFVHHKSNSTLRAETLAHTTAMQLKQAEQLLKEVEEMSAQKKSLSNQLSHD